MLMKAIIALAVALALSAGAVRADGINPVTKTQSRGPNNPACYMFQTGNGPTWYGTSALSPTAEADLMWISLSWLVFVPLNMTIGTVGSDPDCPHGIVGVTGIGVGQ